MPGADTTDATAGKDISIQMTEMSGTEYFGQFFYSNLITECSLVRTSSSDRVTISFTWPANNQIPQVPPMEEKENAVFRKEYEVYGSGGAMYFQNDEHFFNKIQINENSFQSTCESTKATLFNRDGKEIGTFLWKVKPNKPNKRKSLVRQASSHVQHVIRRRRPTSLCPRIIETKKNDITDPMFFYLVLALWVTTIAMVVSNVGSAGAILMAALVMWFFLQSALTYVALEEWCTVVLAPINVMDAPLYASTPLLPH